MTHISHEQAKGAATRLIAAAFRRDGERLPYDKRPQFSIPCRPDRDDDTVIVSYIEQQSALIASQAQRIRELEEAAGRLADRNCTYDTTGLFIPFDSHAQALAAMIDLRSLLSRKGGE